MLEERIGDMARRIDETALAQMGCIGAQHVCLAGGQAGGHDQAVECVIVEHAGERQDEGFLDQFALRGDVEAAAALNLQFHVVQHDEPFLIRSLVKADVESAFADDVEAQVFEQRDAARER